MEIVSEISQTYEHEGVNTSDAEYIVGEFEKNNFTCIYIEHNATRTSSQKEHTRSFS